MIELYNIGFTWAMGDSCVPEISNSYEIALYEATIYLKYSVCMTYGVFFSTKKKKVHFIFKKCNFVFVS